MGFRINTNVTSLAAQRTLGQTKQQQDKTLNQLSSGSRITKAGDDAAGLAISEKLKATIKSFEQANRNANDGISMIQTAEGGMNEISSMLIRLRELAIQSSSDTVGEQERKFSDMEFQNLKLEIERISQVTEFNGTKLLNGEGDQLEFQIGVNNNPEENRLNYQSDKINTTLNSLGVDGLDIESKGSAQGSLSTLDEALNTLSGHRAELGALQNRLQSTSNNILTSVENLNAANSRIRDTDVAQAASENAKNSILSQSGTAVLAQANANAQQALRLIG